jgi:hypothetical protein
MGLFDENNQGRKSSDTVSLNNHGNTDFAYTVHRIILLQSISNFVHF